jgi:hypothetical protein
MSFNKTLYLLHLVVLSEPWTIGVSASLPVILPGWGSLWYLVRVRASRFLLYQLRYQYHQKDYQQKY